ncbi:MAG: hypothetical protein KVP17_002243 [Porospora cf. gigantea B]|uniref:uncharacterized protein n=1 Tax=Porospora cf. gigantea B TaxID=2853592 RepID=UPI003571AD37|nr:MAG: hypothetical protein KVP17_002243 [Porospora cf. gigantea B]
MSNAKREPDLPHEPRYGLKPVRWSESIAQSILALDIQWCSSFTPSQLITSEACDEPCEHWFVMLDDRPATALANPSTYDPTLPTFDKDTIEPPEYRTLLQNSMDALPQMWNCPMNGGRNSVLEEGRVLDSWRTFMSQEVEILGCVAYSGCEAEFEHVHQYLYCGAPGHPKIRMRPFSANRCQYFPFTKFQSTTWKCESYNTRLNPIKRLHTAPLIGRNASMTHCLAECVRHKDNGCR